MSYAQRFGLSRKSPFNVSEREKSSKEEVLNMMTVGVDQYPDLDKDGNINPATAVIEKNNLKSEAGLGGVFDKFLLKEGIKHGLKKYVGPLAGKAFGLATMMLTPTTGYARTRENEIDFEKAEKLMEEMRIKEAKKQQLKRAKEKGVKTIMDPNY